ncbi:hypothetical protein [Spiroplasma endosymbiont of Aspidapion aeneum]|uniref:hypothetical protein n=1 Tax=Spiroplasma endosymbiont of Aspidapion aeneum TaxID=3066276 RepID=UPI00313AA8B4
MPDNKKNGKPLTNRKDKNSLVEGQEYIRQKFNPKSLALIHKFHLQSNPPFAKLITTFQSITELGKSNPRYKELTKMWEDEYNFLFESFWVDYNTSSRQKNASTIGGWQDRLKIKDSNGSSIDDKKMLFIQKIQPSFVNENSNSKKKILERAGFKMAEQKSSMSFTAVGKTKNLIEIENIINDAKIQKKDIDTTDLFKAAKRTPNKDLESEYKIDTKPDPSLSEFLNESGKSLSKYKDESDIEYSLSGKNSFDDADRDANLTDENSDSVELNNKSKANDNSSLRDFINDDDKAISYINSNSDNKFQEKIEGKKIIPNSALSEISGEGQEEIPDEFYQQEFKRLYDQQSGLNINSNYESDGRISQEIDMRIDPTKRNILSKDDFEYTDSKPSLSVNSFSIEKKDHSSNRPYHEVKPVGVYNMEYNPEKRPSTIQNMYFEENEKETDDDLQKKLQILRDLKAQRKHRINMLRLEKSNSSVIAKAINFRNRRELRFARKKNIENMRTMERIEKLRRLQERQRLVNLLKQRQLKLEEEKRVNAQIKLESQKNIEREAQYRMDLASIESQIHREMELIKSIEQKSKAQFLKYNENEDDFDGSISISKKTRFLETKEQSEQELLKEEKNKAKIEEIAMKFKKNL